MLLRARVVLPVTRPPVDNGAVFVAGNRIQAAGSWNDLRSGTREKVVDLGDVILLPGLVNAHCHLDYTDLAEEIAPTKSFTDWIKVITTAKGGKICADFARSWVRGAQMLLRTGTTTVADIEAVPELLPDVRQATPLRVISFLEMTGVRSRREPRQILGEAANKIESLPVSRCAAGLSPHAPYSTIPELLRLSALLAREKGWGLTVHVSESAEEFAMFMEARGEMFDWLKRNGRDMSDCGRGSPVQHLERNGCLADNLLAAHANYLASGDAALLGRRGVSVAHCPRSHAYFGHQKFPREELYAAGVNLCLGTDSLASAARARGRTPELNLFAEMSSFAAVHPDVPSEHIVQMATVNGARALGLRGRIGELAADTCADVIAIPFRGQIYEACDAVVGHCGDVHASLIDGEWAIAPA
ncbi:MAG TPA: amidohydrolase family protein [Candidatus Angelobacter sp.]|nr:amidohydrolase family protein [Candidatus Angelobacter sp.]